jgi:hypothetical protein
MPVKVPSRRQPSSQYWICARECGRATMSSLRVSVQVTGRPSAWAALARTMCSWEIPALAPKPPPTWGAIIRSSALSMPSAPASCRCSRCGIWVEL